MSFDTLRDYSEYAAKEYLQSVVFIDDRIYQADHGSVVDTPRVTTPPKRKPAIKSTDEVAVPEITTSPPNQDEIPTFSSHDIVASFAKKQILCSLFQPKKTASMSEKSDIHNLCSAADIVIVDWDFDGDNGEKAKELVTGLIHKAVSDTPEQLRLILVYTQEIDLFEISNQLFVEVSQSLGDETVTRVDSELSFYTANSRVCVLGKKGRTRAPEAESNEVPENDLADRAIEEFSKLASGLMHAPVLLGLSKIKQNSRKIISKFDSSLDPAFLTHRAMSLPQNDVSEHLVPLLMKEIGAVLEDSLPSPLIEDSVIEDWCNNTWKPGDHLAEEDFGPKNDQQSLGTKFCLTGKEIKDHYPKVPIVKRTVKNENEWKTDRSRIRKLTEILLSNSNDFSNHRFAHLISNRTYYGDRQRNLTLGTIIRLDNGRAVQYLLCLQPVCDSVRLEKKTPFIFVTLQESVADKTSHIVIADNREPIQLIYQPKISNFQVIEFTPSASTKTVITKSEDELKFFSNPRSKTKYIWVGQLETSHAQQAVERYARELSRVGLTESEWLRMMS